MRPNSRLLVLGVIAGTSIFGATAACAGDGLGYVQTNLVSNGAISAKTTDPDLLNAWGLGFFPGAPFWVADNGAGVATLYDGTGAKVPLVVEIPPPHGSPKGSTSAPTGLVANITTQFSVHGSGQPTRFIFDTEDGTIAAWDNAPPKRATIVVDNSGSGAVYKGLALGANAKGNFLFATNFHAGTIDVFDSRFMPATLDGSFADPDLPAGYAPFGIRNVDGDLFVTFAQQNAEKHDDVAGPGHGFVDIFDTDGHLIRRFATRGTLNSPWGITRASFDFGQFSGDILIGDFGDGRINAFDPAGNFLGQLQNPRGESIKIDGLWSLTFGGALKSDPDTLYFTAGPNEETDGLFGSIEPEGRATAETGATTEMSTN
jgi:uncharacterized protein (TIGR03118 family)